MSKNQKKWAPLGPYLEGLLKKMNEQNKEHIDEANKPPPKQDEEVN